MNTLSIDRQAANCYHQPGVLRRFVVVLTLGLGLSFTAAATEKPVSPAKSLSAPRPMLHPNHRAHTGQVPAGLDAKSWESLSTAVTEDAKLTANDAEDNSDFGFSVAVEGDTAVVGSPNDAVGSNAFQGSAYVYVRAGSSWVQQAKLTAGDGASSDLFGFDVAISGDTIVVGAQQRDFGSEIARGAVYVYRRVGNFWQQEVELVIGNAGVKFFGDSVALEGDTLVIGAGLSDIDANNGQGAVYIYQRSGTSWSLQTKLTANDGQPNDYFGDDVAISEDRVVIGAPSRNGFRGAVYVFVRNGAGWLQQSTLIAPDAVGFENLGTSVAVSGDTILAGAVYGNRNGDIDNGAVYIYVFNGSFWELQTKLSENDSFVSSFGDYFGGSVALLGDVAVIGASLNTVNGAAEQGSASVYTRSGTVWTRQSQLLSSDGTAADYFGTSVAVMGTTAVVGARFAGAGGINPGAAYVLGVTPPLPTLQIGNATRREGDKKNHLLRFEVRMSRPSTVPVTVLATTADVDARSGEDYIGGSTTYTFQPGELSLFVKVRVIADKIPEVDEQFTVNLSNPTGAVIAAGQGSGTGIIFNDD